ncbi:MAG: hypothetical protein JTJ11_05350 [Collinsella sp.]|nr:hypothetical protein [Collinsella sp.]
MGEYDYSYNLPVDFENRVERILRQTSSSKVSDAFKACSYEYENVGLAYYAGLRGDNWNMQALDLTVEGPSCCIKVLENDEASVRRALSKGLKSRESGFLVRDLLLLPDASSTYPATNDERFHIDVESARAILADIIAIGNQLCLNSLFRHDRSEDNINDYVRDMLINRGYEEIRDQTRHGLSASGKSAGEVDLLISKAGKEAALIEGLKLNCVNRRYIDSHIKKAIGNYNVLGSATFLLAYVDVDDYESFWMDYLEYLESYDFGLEIKRSLTRGVDPSAATRTASVVLSKDGFDFPVYFVTFRLSCAASI